MQMPIDQEDLRLLLRYSLVSPAANEMEIHAVWGKILRDSFLFERRKTRDIQNMDDFKGAIASLTLEELTDLRERVSGKVVKLTPKVS